jgi:NADH-quinone oxidoreductase subunit J
MEGLLWYLVAGLALGSALGVVLMHKPLYSAFCLVLNLFCVAVMFGFLDAHFLAVSQVIVYAGAIMVLVVFVIMLLSLEGKERSSSKFITVLAAAGVVGLLAMILGPIKAAFPGKASAITGGVEAIGMELYSKYLFSFEIASVLIMVAIVGAVVLARRIKSNAN